MWFTTDVIISVAIHDLGLCSSKAHKLVMEISVFENIAVIFHTQQSSWTSLLEPVAAKTATRCLLCLPNFWGISEK